MFKKGKHIFELLNRSIFVHFKINEVTNQMYDPVRVTK